jgi:predicted RNA-binding Zn-ribbon protein involved in translation (DUF1610 family)
MNLRWLWLDHVPPGIRLAREDRASIRHHARVLRQRQPNFRDAQRKYRRLYFPVALAIVAALFAMAHFDRPFIRLDVIFYSLLLVMLLLIVYAHHRTHGPYTWRALAKVGHEVCTHCGYVLRGLPEDAMKCPECGVERDAEAREEAKRATQMRDFTPNPQREGRPPRWDRSHYQ